MGKILMVFSLISAIFCGLVVAEESSTVLQGKCNAKVNRDFSYLQNKWVDSNDKPSDYFSKQDILRDKVFTDLDTDTPTIKSITPKNKYSDEQVTEFKGQVIHRAGSLVTIRWSNEPFDNKIWIATINTDKKKAVVCEMYDGATSFGVNVETLDLK